MARTQRNRYLRGTIRGRRRRSRLSPFLLSVLLLVSIVATLSHVWIRVDVIQQQIVITSLETEIEKLETSNKYLMVELQDLSDPNHLEAVARNYGFIYPQTGQVIRIATEKSL